MKSLKIALAISFLLTGCTAVKNDKFEGYYVNGFEVSSFRMCNDDKEYWIDGDNMEELNAFSLALSDETGKPYQPVYITFNGYFDDRPAVGFEEEYDGLIYLTSLVSYSKTFPAKCK